MLRDNLPPDAMPIASVTEDARLAALRSYAILDTPPEARFDDIVALAAVLCETPIAAISLVDEHRQWFKATYGLPIRETPISLSFCKHAIAGSDLFVVEDATRDLRFNCNALVTGEPFIRFYAGCPLVTDEGIALGTLMVIDRQPRSLSETQASFLKMLARQVVVALELHRQRSALQQRLAAQAHDHAMLHALGARVAGAGYWSKAPGSPVLDLGGEACRLLRLEQSPATGLDMLLGMMPDTDREIWQSALSACEMQGMPMDVQCQLRQPSGMTVITRWLATRTFAPGASRSQLLGVVVDITASVELAQLQQQAHERFQLVAELISDALWEWDLVHQTVWWNAGMHILFGTPDGRQITPAAAWKLVHPDDLQTIERSIAHALALGASEWRETYRVVRSNGELAWVDNRAAIVRNVDGMPVRMVGAMADISESVRLRAQREADISRLEQQAALLDQARDAILVRDNQHRIEYWNAGAERLYGWTAQEAVGQHAPTLLREEPDQLDELVEKLTADGEYRGDIVHYNRLGQRLYIQAHWTLVRDAAGEPRAMLAVCTDVTQSRRDRERIHYLAFFDSLTGLPNRTLLMDRLQQALAASQRHCEYGALIFLDLDHFKALNDTRGHAVGDQLLQQVGARLQQSVRSMDTVARLGGDEFVILLEQLGDDPAVAVAQAQVVAHKMLAGFSAPFLLGEFEYRCGTSIGVTLFQRSRAGRDELLKQADIAMYEAKQAGRNRVRFFDPQMQQSVNERAMLENDLRRASVQHEFVLYYQPQWRRDGMLAGMEALLRWRHPAHGLLEPVRFIEVAEETGIIVPLGRWVLLEACRQLADWQATGRNLRISVNVSARQLRSRSFVADVQSALAGSGADPAGLCLELTESMLVKDVASTVAKMNALRELGVRFALDDFGTGYSSLSLLERLPLDELKIDRSFVHRVEHAPRDRKVVQSIVTLGKNLDLQVIAEGIETEGQQSWLAEFGCDEFQGYLRGASMPAEQASLVVQAA